MTCWKILNRLQGVALGVALTWTLLIVCVYAAGFQEEPSSAEVNIGSSVTLRCAVSGNLEGVSVYWWNINASRAVSDGTRIVPRYLSQDQVKRYSISGDSSAGEFHLHISNASPIDSAIYSCRIWDGTLWHFSRQVSLDVVRGSPECTMQASLPVDVGDNVRLWCRSYSTDPSVQLHWLSKGRLVPSIPNLSTRTTSVIQHVLTEQDDGAPFMCLETTADERKACQIVPLHRQISVIVQDPVTTVYAGEAATFQCNTGISKDSLTFSWLVNGVPQEETSDYIRLQVGIADNNTRVTCRVQYAVSGLSGENDAMLFVLPRTSTTPFETSSQNTTNPSATIDTKISTGLTSKSNIKPKFANPTSRMITSSKPGSKTGTIGSTDYPLETEEGETLPAVPIGEIERPRPGGSGKSSPSSDNNFMTAFIIGSLLVGMLLVVLIILLIMFLARQSALQRQVNRTDSNDEKSGSNGESIPLGAVTTEESLDSNAGYVHKSPKHQNDKQGLVKETAVDYAILDPNSVDDDSLSDFRLSDELFTVNDSDEQEPKTRKEGVIRTYSSSTRDSTTSSISAYAISNLTASTTPSSTFKPPPPAPLSARPTQRSASCSSLQRPLPAEPTSASERATPKRYTYMTPLELNSEPSERSSLAHISPPVSPRLLDVQRTSCMTALSEEDYAEINDLKQQPSAYQQQQQQSISELSRLKGASEKSSTPSVGSQEDSALGSGSSMEALAMEECPYATIGDEQAQNRQRKHEVLPTSPISTTPVEQDDIVIVSIEDIPESQDEHVSHHPYKSKMPVYAKVDKSKKKKKNSATKTDTKSAKDKERKTPSWQMWLESVIANGSNDSKHKGPEKNKETSDQQMTPAYATVWPQEQATNA